MIDPINRIWAYLHNEMDAEEKEFFQQALRVDAELREEVERCRATHYELKNLLPNIGNEESNEALEARLLTKWETEHPEYVEAPRRKMPRRILLYPPLLAAAATLAILLSLPVQTGPVRWQRSAYGTAPQLRGETGIRAHYTRKDLKELDRTLRQSVETACQQLDEPPEKCVLKISLQELAGGALFVEISGRPRAAPEFSKHWSKSFQGLEIFHAEVPVFGEQVAKDLPRQVD